MHVLIPRASASAAAAPPFCTAARSRARARRDECPSRGMLSTALRVFERLHSLVFERMRAAPPSAAPSAVAPWDVRRVMAAEKRLVLAGVVLAFSRVIPLESDPRCHPLWQLAEQFGAACGEGCSDATTHIVATHGGTEKVRSHVHRRRGAAGARRGAGMLGSVAAAGAARADVLACACSFMLEAAACCWRGRNAHAGDVGEAEQQVCRQPRLVSGAAVAAALSRATGLCPHAAQCASTCIALHLSRAPACACCRRLECSCILWQRANEERFPTPY